MPYAIVGHTADVRMRVTGTSREKLFEDALAGMMVFLDHKKAPCASQGRDARVSGSAGLDPRKHGDRVVCAGRTRESDGGKFWFKLSWRGPAHVAKSGKTRNSRLRSLRAP